MIFYPTKSDQNVKLNLPGTYTEDFLKLPNKTSVHYIVQKIENPKGVILYFHGNAGCLETGWAQLAHELADRSGYEVWMMDYPGFGKSSDSLPSSEVVLIEMGLQFIKMIRQVHPDLPLVLFGRSIGSGIAGTLARTEKIEGLILETPYTSLVDMTKELFPWVPSVLMRFDLDNSRLTEAKYSFKTLILHGTADEVIPYKFSERLAQNVKCQFVTIPGGRHNDLSLSQDYWPAILKFLNTN